MKIKHYCRNKINTVIEIIVPFLYLCTWEVPISFKQPLPTTHELHFVMA